MRTFTRRRSNATMFGIAVYGPPGKGWRRDDPGGDGTAGGSGGTGGTGGTTPPKPTPPTPTITGTFDPDRAAHTIASAREGEKAAKERAKTAEADAKAAGERAEKAEQRARQLVARDAVRTAAGKHDADAETLLDSASFLGKLSNLDVDADDYGAKVADLVKAEVEANARFKKAPAGQGPARMGAEHTGSGGTGRQRPTSIGAAVSAHYQRP